MSKGFLSGYDTELRKDDASHVIMCSSYVNIGKLSFHGNISFVCLT